MWNVSGSTKNLMKKKLLCLLPCYWLRKDRQQEEVVAIKERHAQGNILQNKKNKTVIEIEIKEHRHQAHDIGGELVLFLLRVDFVDHADITHEIDIWHKFKFLSLLLCTLQNFKNNLFSLRFHSYFHGGYYIASRWIFSP